MDAKHGNELVVTLLKELKKREVKIPRFSKETGIPKDRVYKWIQEGNNPKADDEKKITAWIKMEKPPLPEAPEEQKGEPGTLTEALAIIKQQNAFLQDLVKSNLAGLSRDVNNNAAAIQAEIRGYGKYQILKQSNWDDQEFAKAMAVVDRIYGEELKIDDGQGSHGS